MNWPSGPRRTWEQWADNNEPPDALHDDESAAQAFPDGLLNSHEAGAFMGVSHDWVNTLARRGKLEAVRVGRVNFFEKAKLAAYTAERGIV